MGQRVMWIGGVVVHVCWSVALGHLEVGMTGEGGHGQAFCPL